MKSAALRLWIIQVYFVDTDTLVHDFWKAYNDYSCNHALCYIHHLRDLTFYDEVMGCKWASAAKQYLLGLYEKVEIAKEKGA